MQVSSPLGTLRRGVRLLGSQVRLLDRSVHIHDLSRAKVESLLQQLNLRQIDQQRGMEARLCGFGVRS